MDNLNLSELRKQITERFLAGLPREEDQVGFLRHNAGSGIVTNWDPRDRLPDIDFHGRELRVPYCDPIDRYREMIRQLAGKWCNRGLAEATVDELDAAVHGKKIIHWYRFEKQCNIPRSGAKDQIAREFNEYAWSCFQEECFNRLGPWGES